MHQDAVHQFIVPLDSGKPFSLLQQDVVCFTLKHPVVLQGGLLHANNKEF
jgi:hypothetical protein